jgi:triosephosphate isomerase
MENDKRLFFAANWKMHVGPEGARAFVDRFREAYAPRSDARVVFFPPAISITAFRAAASDRPDLELGVQDVHQEQAGAHTGAVSASMAREAGCTWALAGHSERRREFGEDDATVAAKVRAIQEADMAPVLCVGETLEEREAGRLESVLIRQIEVVLGSLAVDDRHAMTYAYEPVWAIGTGRTASPSDAAQAHEIMRSAIERNGGRGEAAILYGGSVKPGNIAELLAAPGVDGVLVGGASLDPESFAAICSARP